jgi:hypothetical protein
MTVDGIFRSRQIGSPSIKGFDPAETKYLGCFSLAGLSLLASMVHLSMLIVVIILSCILEKKVTPRKITQTINVWVSDLKNQEILFPSTRNLTAQISLSETCNPFVPVSIPTTTYDDDTSNNNNNNNNNNNGQQQVLTTTTTTTIFPKLLLFGEVDNRICIGLFFMLSFAFQLYKTVDFNKLFGDTSSSSSVDYISPLSSSSSNKRFYTNIEQGRVSKSHFIEYSFSATLMILVMITQIGVTDLTVIVNTCVNTWACMVFGLLAEFILDAEYDSEYLKNLNFFGFKLSLIAHFIGWIPLFSVVFTLITPLATYRACIVGKTVIPDFVFVFVTGEICLFCAFGLVQYLSIRKVQQIRTSKIKNTDTDDDNEKMMIMMQNACATTEARYIFLSLFAKTFLALTIYVGINTQPG